tara:strand:+ start:4593 stop:5078 length:486 start_codon:yes stop_codon:yes gene_type:complete
LGSRTLPYAENSLAGTTHWFSSPSHRRQCGEDTLRTLVTPPSALPLMNVGGFGMPRRAGTSSRSPTGIQGRSGRLSSRSTIDGMVARILETEAPVRDDVVAQRSARAHGWLLTGSRIRDKVDRHLRPFDFTHDIADSSSGHRAGSWRPSTIRRRQTRTAGR